MDEMALISRARAALNETASVKLRPTPRLRLRLKFELERPVCAL